VYGGYVDLVKGELVETWHKIVADGVNVKCNTNYSNDTYIAAGIVYLSPKGKYDGYSVSSTVLCNNIPVYAVNQSLPNNWDFPFIRTTSNGQ